jgi:hypothetical protein
MRPSMGVMPGTRLFSLFCRFPARCGGSIVEERILKKYFTYRYNYLSYSSTLLELKLFD